MTVRDERIAAMLLGRRAVRPVPVPGFEAREGEEQPTVGVRILLESEIDEARLDAIQYVETQAKKRNLDSRHLLELDAELLDREVQRAIVQRAFVDVGSGGDIKPGQEPAKFFESLARVRMLDSVLLRWFFDVYLDHQNYVSPYRSLSEDAVRELADALSKEPMSPAILAQFDADSLRRLVLSLVSRHAT